MDARENKEQPSQPDSSRVEAGSQGGGRVRLALAAILLLALGLRVWGIDFGLPYHQARPDEHRVVAKGFSIATSDFNPRFFRYPSLYMYTLAALDAVYFQVGQWSGRFESWLDLRLEFLRSPANVMMIGRWVNVLLATASVLLLYLAALRVTAREGARSIALLAAFFFAVAFLAVRDARFAVTDTPMTFWVVASALAVLRMRERPSWGRYATAGLCIGLAASTKYPGGFMVAPFLLVHALHARGAAEGSVRLFDRRVLGAVAIMIAAFVAGTPYAIMDPVSFVKDIGAEGEHQVEGHVGAPQSGFVYYSTFALRYGLGLPLLLASLIGWLTPGWRDRASRWVWLAFPLVLYLVIGASNALFVRYAIPLVPFLCVSAAVGLYALTQRAPRRALGLMWTIGVVAAAPSLVRSVQYDRLMARSDNRVVAAEWIAANLPPGSTLAQFTRYAGVRVQQDLESLRAWADRERASEGPDAELIEAWARDREDTPEGLVECVYFKRSGRFQTQAGPLEGMPDYWVVSHSPMTRRPILADELLPVLDEQYRSIQRFEAHGESVAPDWYDPGDAFYVPYASVRGVVRPGPNIEIYARID